MHDVTLNFTGFEQAFFFTSFANFKMPFPVLLWMVFFLRVEQKSSQNYQVIHFSSLQLKVEEKLVKICSRKVYVSFLVATMSKTITIRTSTHPATGKSFY